MILAVDAGNSRIKAMLVSPRRVVSLFAAATPEVRDDPGEFRRRLEKARIRFVGLEGGALCSVVPVLDRPLTSAMEAVAGNRVFVVRHTSRFPFRLGVADARKVGADRLAAAAGAVEEGRPSAIVVDIGSAITVDLVFDGIFRGGLIMPGPGLSLRALGQYASRLPAVDPRRLRTPPPERFDDTRPSMMLGARVAARGAVIDGVRTLKRACGAAPRVFLTGGGVGMIEADLPGSWRRDPHLVGRGLLKLWLLNARAPKKA